MTNIKTHKSMTTETIEQLIDQAKSGDEHALAELFNRYKRQLRSMIAFRMDHKLKGRVDPSDVLQEAYLDLAQKLPEFESKGMSFFVWLRLVVSERLIATHRHHLDVQKRDAGKEIRVAAAGNGNASSMILAEHLLGQYTSVVGQAIKAEQQTKLKSVLDQMDETDREVIALRIFERLSNGEAAEVLGLTKQTTSKRFFRAIERLRETVLEIPGF